MAEEDKRALDKSGSLSKVYRQSQVVRAPPSMALLQDPQSAYSVNETPEHINPKKWEALSSVPRRTISVFKV